MTDSLQLCPDCNDWLDPAEDFNPGAEVCRMCEKARLLPATVVAAGDPRGKQATWTLLPAPPGVEGECMQCGRVHEPDQPHDNQSMRYQYAFYAEHDRWPTWADAMAHCTPEVQEAWKTALRERGVDV